ncbi:MAG: hypothetical protein J6X02_01430 [Bacilli bacterium]|nr:hypothetical protein [Bacilli bacterium]
MKKAFIYYSLTGNGDIVSKFYKEKGYDVIKVITNEPLPKNYFFGMLTGGFKAFLGYKDNIKEIKNINDYKKIVIGSPIWNSRLSTPINSVLDKIGLDKDISFVLYSGSGKSKKATKFIHERYGEVKITNLKEPKKNKNELNKLK